MPARAQLKAFLIRASFVSKLAKTSLTNLTNSFYEALRSDWALGFLHAPAGGTRLQETTGEEPPAMTGFVQMPVVWQKLTPRNTWSFTLLPLPSYWRGLMCCVWDFCHFHAAWSCFQTTPVDPCLGDGAGRVAAACPFVLGFIVTQLRSEQIQCLKAYPPEL